MPRYAHHSMPTWPTPAGRRAVTIELPISQVEHLDAQAATYGCSRAAYIRRLIVDDIKATKAAQAKGRA